MRMFVRLVFLFLTFAGMVRAEEIFGTCATCTGPVAATANSPTGLAGLPITFDEFAMDTAITDQYSSLGIIFDGENPRITDDGSNPFPPVLAGFEPERYMGDIEGYFVNPYNPTQTITVSWFSFTAGYFDETGKTLLEWFDINGNKLGEMENTETGIQTFYVEGFGIASWRIGGTEDGNGFAIDNINFGGLNLIDFDISDDVEDGQCVSPEDDIKLTICFTNDSDITYNDAIIKLYLDKGVTYPYADWTIDENMISYPPDPWYDPNYHAYSWEIGDLAPDDTACVDIEVNINEAAIPGMELVNNTELTALVCRDYLVTDPNTEPNTFISVCEVEVIARSVEKTAVCCWGDYDKIFVDQYATGICNGLSWQNAFSGTDGLSKALYQAKNSACGGPFTIYIASGNYFPGEKEDDSFVLPEGTQIYGGFPTGGCDFSARNPKVYEALLTGQVDDDLLSEIDNVVTMGHNTLLDGVAIARGINSNIYGNTVDFTLKNCSIKESELYGIYALNGNVTIERCKIQENFSDGIYHEGSGFTLEVSNSWIMRNGENGIRSYTSVPLVKNSIISESDMKDEGNQGLRILYPSESPVLHNNTLANNKAEGIYFRDSGRAQDPNDPNTVTYSYPDIQNCIIYFNNGGQKQISGVSPDMVASYCCIQDCNSVNNNINTNPGFAYITNLNGTPNPENYHLSAASPCKDIGSPYLDYSGQTDYDAEARFVGEGVEIGADELHTCTGDYSDEDFVSEADFNADGIVNLNDFQQISGAWLSHDPNDLSWNDPNSTLNWSGVCNLADSDSSQYAIDIADLEEFVSANGWLWQACWYGAGQSVATEAMTMMALPEISATESFSLASVNSADILPLARVSGKMILEETTPIEEEVNPYAEMTNAELAIFVRDIQELKAMIVTQVESGCEDSEDLTEILDFFDNILEDVKESMQKQ